MSQISDEKLNDFIAGTLPEVDMQEIEAMLNNDPALCARVEHMSAQATAELAQTVSSAVDNTVKSEVPSAIMDMLRPTETVVDIGSAKKPAAAPRRYFQPAAIAASMAIAAVASLMLLQPSPTGVSLPKHTVIALNTLADGAQNDATTIGESYLDNDGQFCRSFQLENTNKHVGLACKSDTEANSGWQLVALVTAPTGAAYFPAGAGIDTILNQYTEPMHALADGAETNYLPK